MKQTQTGVTGQSQAEKLTAVGEVPKADAPKSEVRKSPDSGKSWMDIPSDLYSNSVSDTYKSILADSNGSKELSADQVSFTDAKGGNIIKNTKTGEITSQSADGGDVYTRKPDGTEIYRSKDVEYSKTKDGKYQVRDEKGDVTDVTSQGAITKIDGQFKMAQRTTTIDETAAKPERGQLETMKDGQRYMDKSGNVVVARENGIREVTTQDGHHFKIDREHNKLEVEQNGSWRELNKTEPEKFQQGHEHADSDGRRHFQFDGVDIDADGKVNTADNVTLGEAAVGGKMVAHIPTTDGQSAVVTNNPDHTSDLALHGDITKVNLDDPAHLVERFQQNPDGSQGISEFNYNSVDNSFATQDLQWNQYGTQVGWNNCDIDGNGNVSNDSGQSVFSDDSASQIDASDVETQQSSLEANSAVSLVSGELSSQSADAGDLGMLDAAAGDLNFALTDAMAHGNFGAAMQISLEEATISTSIDAVNRQMAVEEQDRTRKAARADTSAFSFLSDLTFS